MRMPKLKKPKMPKLKKGKLPSMPKMAGRVPSLRVPGLSATPKMRMPK